MPASTDKSDPETWLPDHEALRAAPRQHRVIFENDLLRVLSVSVAAGSAEPFHETRMCAAWMVSCGAADALGEGGGFAAVVDGVGCASAVSVDGDVGGGGSAKTMGSPGSVSEGHPHAKTASRARTRTRRVIGAPPLITPSAPRRET